MKSFRTSGEVDRLSCHRPNSLQWWWLELGTVGWRHHAGSVAAQRFHFAFSVSCKRALQSAVHGLLWAVVRGWLCLVVWILVALRRVKKENFKFELAVILNF